MIRTLVLAALILGGVVSRADDRPALPAVIGSTYTGQLLNVKRATVRRVFQGKYWLEIVVELDRRAVPTKKEQIFTASRITDKGDTLEYAASYQNRTATVGLPQPKEVTLVIAEFDAVPAVKDIVVNGVRAWLDGR